MFIYGKMFVSSFVLEVGTFSLISKKIMTRKMMLIIIYNIIIIMSAYETKNHTN